MQQQNQAKAANLYGVVDESAGFYRPHAQTDCRSLMNVTFRLPSDELQSRFLSEATEQKLTNLKGHRSVGGIRASIYNAQPVEGVNALASFMKDFANANG
jgi:phosphoserine aminotransferase